MRKKIIGIFVCMLIITTALPVVGNYSEEPNKNICFIADNPLDGGWLEEIDGVKVLHLNGSNYNMGYQYGYFLKTEIQENIRCINDDCDHYGWTYEKRIEVWNIQKEYLPQCYIKEMQGMANGSGIPFEEIAVHNILYDLINFPSCWGAVLWGSATKDGNLYHMRSADGTFIKDPITGKFIHENTALIIRKPQDGYASIDPEFIGIIFSIGGFNEKGIGVSELSVYSADCQIHGISAAFRMRMVLDYAADIYDAEDILNSYRTCGVNFVISDGNIPVGYIIEQSANLVYTGCWCDPVESTKPFWPLQDVVRRGNCYINPLLAKNERERYDPSGLSGFILFLLQKNPSFVPWTQYKTMSNEIEKRYGNLDLNSTMTMFRDVYLGKTNFIFDIMQQLRFYNSGHQWVACPKTGDILLSIGSHENPAYKNPVHRFNLFELLNSEPP
jgi:hypothetical protein